MCNGGEDPLCLANISNNHGRLTINMECLFFDVVDYIHPNHQELKTHMERVWKTVLVNGEVYQGLVRCKL